MSAARAAAPVTFVNADLGGQRSSLRLQGGRITHLHTPPLRGDLVLDLGGDRVLPGLINAHDHLQLNHFPALQYPALYRNATEWIEDFNARLRDNPAVRASAAVPRAQRLLGGGLKNLLSGVTTVAHHDPLDALLQQASFPTRVVREFGWSHSLHVDGEARVRAACAGTPAGQPWVIHAAEGVDAQAHAEFERLAALGCLRPHTLLVHALGLDESQRQRLAASGGGVIWCPTSNLRLFGRTAALGDLIAAGRVALGSDSRLTATGDLLQELSAAKQALLLEEATLERLVTSDSARLLRLKDCGTLAPGAHADLIVLPAAMPLSQARRADLRLVVLGGAVRYGDADYVHALATAADFIAVQVDARAKLLQRQVATSLIAGAVSEPGVRLPDAPGRVACG
jgi:cytosine/adenosine deaminase-related metal-dependent hydrolase